MYNLFYETLKQTTIKSEFDNYFAMIEEYRTEKSENTERHHIFPVSIFGKNNITCTVPMKIHFKLHVILQNMYDDKVHIKNFRKMANAVHKMMQGRTGFTAEEYEIARLAIISAKKGTCTVYDKLCGKYIKYDTALIDNIRYFPCSLRTYMNTNKSTWMSIEDPKFSLTKAKTSIQLYFDTIENKKVKLEAEYVNSYEDRTRYIHCRVGTTFSLPSRKGFNLYYDSANKEYKSVHKDEAKKNGWEGCSYYKDLETGESHFMAPSIAKANPNRYVNNNKGGSNHYFRDTLKPTRLLKHQYDPKLHMTRGEYNRTIREPHAAAVQPK